MREMGNPKDRDGRDEHMGWNGGLSKWADRPFFLFLFSSLFLPSPFSLFLPSYDNKASSRCPEGGGNALRTMT